MTGPGCFIIINCGMPKGSAHGLEAMYANGNVAMRSAAAIMRDKLDEVCRFGETIAITATSIDQEDLREIYELHAADLGKDIDAYVIAHGDDQKFTYLGGDGLELLSRINKFTTALTLVFEAIVAEYGPQIEAAQKS